MSDSLEGFSPLPPMAQTAGKGAVEKRIALLADLLKHVDSLSAKYIVIEVLADEITRSPIHTAGKVGAGPGYALRFPRLVAFRENDKKPEDATTVEELMELYHSQGPRMAR